MLKARFIPAVSKSTFSEQFIVASYRRSFRHRHFSQQPLSRPKYRPADSSPFDNAEALVGLSGGQIFHEMMLRHGVEKVFGYPGGAILPVFDAIHESKHFDFILP